MSAAAGAGEAAPAISVIVPNYRHARYLPKRIESILGQTRGDFELLILDDHSPDDSRAVIERYAAQDPRIRTCFNERNSGNTYLQWQKGLALTTGAYVWMSESDDWAEPTLLERLAGKLDAHPAAGLAFCETNIVDAEDRHIAHYFAGWRDGGHSRYDLAVLDRDFVMDGRDYLRGFMIPWNTLPNASAVLFRRAALAAAGGPVTSMRLCGDWLTYCRILADHQIGHVADRLNHFREHSVNVRSASKGEVLAREAQQVMAWAERTIGPLPPETKAELADFYVNVLLGAARDPASGRVPAGRIPAVLARVARHDLGLVPKAAAALARQVAGRLRRR